MKRMQKFYTSFRLVAVVTVSLLFFTACVTKPPYDYTAFNANKPRSILVLPPLNNSVEVNAPYIYLSKVTEPLAERGYYVFPVAVIEQFMKENGLPSAEDMHSVPLDKISEIINPDAVLYMTIKEWGQKYQVISSKGIVSMEGKLVDAATGTLLWEGEAQAIEQSDGGQNGLAGMLAAALVSQIVGKVVDKTPQLAKQANYQLFYLQDQGLLPGPYAEQLPNN